VISSYDEVAPLPEMPAGAPLASAASWGIMPFYRLKPLLTAHNRAQGLVAHETSLEAYHLIEPRFAELWGEDPDLMLAIALTPDENRAFTAAWKAAIPFGRMPAPSRAEVEAVARRIYASYPAVLAALGL